MRCAPLVFLACLATLTPLAGASGDGPSRFHALVEEALAARALHRSDTGMPIDLEPADPFRLAVVDRLMLAPLETPGWSDSLVVRLADTSRGGAGALQELYGLLARSGGSAAGSSPGVSPPLSLDGPSLVELCLSASLALEAERERMTSVLPEEGVEVLWRDGHRLLEESREDRDKDIFTLEREKWEQAAWAENLLTALSRLDTYGYLRRSVEELVRFEAAALSSAGEIAGLAGESVVRRETPAGVILVGTSGRDIFDGSPALILDPGGDDLYLLDAPARPMAFTAIVDVGGNDTYQGTDRAPFASGVFGASILVDFEGDDVYRAGSVSLGAGWLGAGYLVDRDGYDSYQGDLFVQGAGCCGIGYLRDESGADSYTASMKSQGFGFVGGAGLLHDLEGRDLYAVRPLYTDVLRYQDHVLSLSQGFAFGWRPRWSGGVGILLDGDGHDTYLSDIFGQGGSYWFGLGLLADRSGNDTYSAYQYAQGSGIHLSVGVLRDAAGNDLYQAKGVSQGCGHDLAPGLLLDGEGDDVYVASELSQGAGSANGFGLLWDGRGRDVFLARNPVSTHGYGNPRRGYGSIGLLVDGAGRDHFFNRSPEPEPADSGAPRWAEPSRWGARLDAAGPDPEEEAYPPDEALPVPEGPFDIPELFTMASSGEPKFRDARDFARGELKARGREAVDSLLYILGTPDPRDRNTIRDVFRDLDSTSVAPLIDVLQHGGGDMGWEGVDLGPSPPATASAVQAWRTRERRLCCETLGYIGGPEALPALRGALADSSPVVRGYAAMSLGRIGEPETAPDLCAALATEPNRRARARMAWALGRLPLDSTADCLVEHLDDAFFGVRWISAGSLASREEGRTRLMAALADGAEDLWIMALDLTCREDSLAAGTQLAGTPCGRFLDGLLGLGPDGLSHGGRRVSATLRRLVRHPAVGVVDRHRISRWLGDLERAAGGSGPGENR